MVVGPGLRRANRGSGRAVRLQNGRTLAINWVHFVVHKSEEFSDHMLRVVSRTVGISLVNLLCTDHFDRNTFGCILQCLRLS